MINPKRYFIFFSMKMKQRDFLILCSLFIFKNIFRALKQKISFKFLLSRFKILSLFYKTQKTNDKIDNNLQNTLQIF